jgi:myb proto-oncogene protein
MKASSPIPKNTFTPEEDKLLLDLVSTYQGKNWKVISSFIPNKNYIQCFSRYRRIRPGIKRGAWTKEEDETIIELYNKFGKQWSYIAKHLNGRNGKQVRDRYINILDPNLNKSSFSTEEDNEIMKYYLIYGAKWAKIAKESNMRRSPDMVKNRFYSKLKKQRVNKLNTLNNTHNINSSDSTDSSSDIFGSNRYDTINDDEDAQNEMVSKFICD